MVANGKLRVSWVDLVCLVIKKRLEHYIHKHSNQVLQKPIKLPNLETPQHGSTCPPLVLPLYVHLKWVFRV